MKIAAFALMICLASFAEDGTVIEGDLGKACDEAVQAAGGGGFWGAVLVAKDGKPILAKGYGEADYASTPNTPKTLFELASASKQFTAVAALRAQMKGLLSVADPISKHLKGVPDDKKGITVRHLLTHTSGIDDEAAGVPYSSEMKTDDLVEHVLASQLASKPGEKFSYSNFGYALLAAVVEKAAGKPFDDFVREELFAPAGLTDTGFIQDPRLDKTRASARHGEPPAQGTCVDWFWGWGYRGMGGVVTTVYDVLAWDRALRGEKVLDAKTKAELYRPEKDGYACGWFVQPTPRGTTRAWHAGGVAGYRTMISRYLEEDVVIVVLGNEETEPFGVEAALAHVLFPSAIEAKVHVAGFEMNQWNAVVLEHGTAWTVRREKDLVVMVLEDTAKKAAIAEVSMPAATARGIADQIEAYAKEKAAAGAPAGGMESGVFLGRYEIPKDGNLAMRGLDLQIMPSYHGQDADGNAVVDDRVTLIVVDPQVGQWPVMVKMDVASAQGLVAALKAAAGK